MIEFSVNKAALLRLFFANPDRSFYMQEIGRIISKKPGVFQKAINSLAREGILVSEYKANVRYFNINKEYPLYNEFKSIVFKTVGVSDNLKKVLQKTGNIDFSFIYGSYAKGNKNYLSDIDMVIVGSPDENLLIEEFDKLGDSLKREINYKLYSLKYFKKAIAAKEPFLLEVLKDKKIILWESESELRKIYQRQTDWETAAGN